MNRLSLYKDVLLLDFLQGFDILFALVHNHTPMKLLIVDDDIGLAHMLRDSLSAKAYSIDLAHDGGEGSFMGKMYSYDAILLDYSLPKKDGLAICKDIRGAGKTTPIIFLSVIDSIDTKIAALDHGADDRSRRHSGRFRRGGLRL